MEGNLPVSSKCAVCDKTCGSVLRFVLLSYQIAKMLILLDFNLN